MYSKNEQPSISASLFYYDSEYELQTAIKVLKILEEHMFFPPARIYAGKLTNNKFKKVDAHVRELFVQAYSERDVLGIEMASGDSRKVSDYWRFTWMLTYLKNSKLVGGCKFKPWNVLTIQSTYGRLQNPDTEQQFMSCVKSLIDAISPFYASIDDISNKVILQDRSNETHFMPGIVQTIYWGNYLGKEYVENYGEGELLALPAYKCEKQGAGILFTLSDSLHIHNGRDVTRRRNQIIKFFKDNKG